MNEIAFFMNYLARLHQQYAKEMWYSKDITEIKKRIDNLEIELTILLTKEEMK